MAITCGTMIAPLLVSSALAGILSWKAPYWAVKAGNHWTLRLLKAIINFVPRTAMVLIFGWLVVANTFPAVMQYELARHIQQTKTVLDQYPTTVPDRLLPRSTGFEYLIKANESRTKQIDRSHLVWMPVGTQSSFDGDSQTVKASEKEYCVWQAPLKFNPNVTKNKYWFSFWGSVEGVIRIDCSDMRMHADVQSGKDAFFMFGADSWVTETIFRLRHPLSEMSQRVYWQKDDGSWSFIISSTTYKPTWSGVMIPVMGGAMEFGSYGTFTNYSPDQAKENFPGTTLFPPELALEYGDAYRLYRGGLQDILWDQEDLLEISQDPSESDKFPNQNSHPYYQNMAGIGPQLTLPFEPEGAQANALTTVLLFDAANGAISEFTRVGEPIVSGPRTALENVKDAAPDWEWMDYNKVEPMLIHTEDGRWYTQVGVVRKDSNASVGVVVVNSVELNSEAFSSKEVEAYLRYIESGVEPESLQERQVNN